MNLVELKADCDGDSEQHSRLPAPRPSTVTFLSLHSNDQRKPIFCYTIVHKEVDTFTGRGISV